LVSKISVSSLNRSRDAKQLRSKRARQWYVSRFSVPISTLVTMVATAHSRPKRKATFVRYEDGKGVRLTEGKDLVEAQYGHGLDRELSLPPSRCSSLTRGMKGAHGWVRVRNRASKGEVASTGMGSIGSTPLQPAALRCHGRVSRTRKARRLGLGFRVRV
jgi:hypothetical protein